MSSLVLNMQLLSFALPDSLSLASYFQDFCLFPLPEEEKSEYDILNKNFDPLLSSAYHG